MEHLLQLLFPILILLLCVYGLFSELLTRKLRRDGLEATAKVVSVDRAVAFGLRNFLATISQKSEKEHQFGCDYILTLQFKTQGGEDVSVQTAVPARMRMLRGERMPYFMAGNTVPVRYSPRNPKRLVVMLDEVAARQGPVWKIVVWGFCTALMLAVCVAILVL